MRRSALLKKVSNYVRNAASPLERQRYVQEGAYVPAFLARLEGKIDLGTNNGTIELRATVVADKGPGAAERKFGADFALVFKSNGGPQNINKAIIAQAKNGHIESMSRGEVSRLRDQCKHMASATEHYFVLEAPLHDGNIPTVRLGTHKNQSWASASIPFDAYLVDHIISCQHGDRRKTFIDAVGNSRLLTLKVNTTNLTFEPDPPSLSEEPSPF